MSLSLAAPEPGARGPEPVLASPECLASFSRDQIAALAELAHLELDDEEAESFRASARRHPRLRHAGAADRHHRRPADGERADRLVNESGDRDDETSPSMDRQDALANAPDAAREAGLFKVPRVIG